MGCALSVSLSQSFHLRERNSENIGGGSGRPGLLFGDFDQFGETVGDDLVMIVSGEAEAGQVQASSSVSGEKRTREDLKALRASS